jgi:hypothetical protein
METEILQASALGLNEVLIELKKFRLNLHPPEGDDECQLAGMICGAIKLLRSDVGDLWDLVQELKHKQPRCNWIKHERRRTLQSEEAL